MGSKKFLKVGLTGGIASGKSTVAKLWQAAGVAVIDIDAIARDLQEHDPELLQATIAEFGTEVLNSKNGKLDRQALAKLVFNDPAALKKLEELVQPVVNAEVARQEAKFLAVAPGLIVHDHPLIFENQLQANFDYIVLVDAPDELRIQRIINNRGHSREYARSVLKNQLSIEQKLQQVGDIPHLIINNDATRVDLVNKAQEALETLLNFVA